MTDGFPVSRICQVLEFNSSRYYRHQRADETIKGQEKTVRMNKETDRYLMEKIKDICVAYPFWGSRRVTNWLRKREQIMINRKKTQRLMRMHNLTVAPHKKPASRESNRSKPQATRPLQWWGIDMTKFMVDQLGWIYHVSVVDWYSRKVVGYALGRDCQSDLWIKALEQAVLSEFPEGSRGKSLFLMSDNGSQPTSKKFRNVTGLLGIQQVFTSYNNPKGNADTERWFRTFKEDCICLHEWEIFDQLERDIRSYIEFYNNDYVHSSLNGMSPNEFLRDYVIKNAA